MDNKHGTNDKRIAMNKTLVILFLLVCSMTLITYSQTADSLIFDKVLKQLELKKSDCHPDLTINKMMPYDTNKSVWVIPVMIEKTEEW